MAISQKVKDPLKIDKSKSNPAGVRFRCPMQSPLAVYK